MHRSRFRYSRLESTIPRSSHTSMIDAAIRKVDPDRDTGLIHLLQRLRAILERREREAERMGIDNDLPSPFASDEAILPPGWRRA